MIGDPLFGRTRDGDQIFEVIETERSPITPHAGLILEWAGEGRREKRTLLADILPDHRLDVAASQRIPQCRTRCQSVMRSRGAVQRLDQRPSIRRPWP